MSPKPLSSYDEGQLPLQAKSESVLKYEEKESDVKDGDLPNNSYELCMTIYIGPCKTNRSEENHHCGRNSKEIRLPYANMVVSPKPHNYMGLLGQKNYKDITFSVQIFGTDNKSLIVTRTDCDKGWDFDLQLKAYYSKKSVGTSYKEFEYELKSRDSELKISLHPLQTIRCIPKALIFTDENITAKIPKIPAGVSKLYGLRGLITSRFANAKSRSSNSITGTTSSSSHSFSEYAYVGKEETKGELILGAYSSKIIHFSLGEYGNKITVKKGTCLAMSSDIKVFDSSLDLDGHFHSLVGYGDVFIQVGMSTKKIILQDDKDILCVKDNCVIAFTQDMKSKSELTDDFCGIVLSKTIIARTLVGPGIVWLTHTRADIIGFEREGIRITSGMGDGMVPGSASIGTRSCNSRMMDESHSSTCSELMSFASNDFSLTSTEWSVEDSERLREEEANVKKQKSRIEEARLRIQEARLLQKRQQERCGDEKDEKNILEKDSKLRTEVGEATDPEAADRIIMKTQEKDEEASVTFEKVGTGRRHAESPTLLRKLEEAEQNSRAKEVEEELSRIREEKDNQLREVARLRAEKRIRVEKRRKLEEKRKLEKAEAVRLQVEEKRKVEQAETNRLKAEERIRFEKKRKEKEQRRLESTKAVRLVQAEEQARLRKQKKEEEERKAEAARLQAEKRIRLQKQKEKEEKRKIKELEEKASLERKLKQEKQLLSRLAKLQEEIKAKLQQQKMRNGGGKLLFDRSQSGAHPRNSDILKDEQTDSLSSSPQTDSLSSSPRTDSLSSSPQTDSLSSSPRADTHDSDHNEDSLSTDPIGDDSIESEDWNIDYDFSDGIFMPVNYVVVNKQSEGSESEISSMSGNQHLSGSNGNLRKVNKQQQNQKSGIAVFSKCNSSVSSNTSSLLSMESSLGPNETDLRLSNMQSKPMQERRQKMQLAKEIYQKYIQTD
jgi:uncharacterized protein (AIM24 family)